MLKNASTYISTRIHRREGWKKTSNVKTFNFASNGKQLRKQTKNTSKDNAFFILCTWI